MSTGPRRWTRLTSALLFTHLTGKQLAVVISTRPGVWGNPNTRFREPVRRRGEHICAFRSETSQNAPIAVFRAVRASRSQRARQGEIIPSVRHSVRRICATALSDVALPQM